MESALSKQTRKLFQRLETYSYSKQKLFLNSKRRLLSETTIIYLPRRAQQRSVLEFTLLFGQETYREPLFLLVRWNCQEV